MVFYFTSTVVSPPAFIYVGKDKFESTLKTTTIHKKHKFVAGTYTYFYT